MPALRGWCPDVFMPMQSGDGWLLRIKPRLGRIGAAEGRRVAAEAARLGNGIVELTGRGNLQLRGFTPDSAREFAGFAVALGLASNDPAVERRRNILVSPLAGGEAVAIALQLERRLAESPWLGNLPGKFGFGIDDGGVAGLPEGAADILLRAHSGGWGVGLGGGVVRRCKAQEAACEAVSLATEWLRAGGGARSAPCAPRAPAAVGWLGERAFGIGLPFGETDAAGLDRLCELAEGFGDGVLHVTPWRTIMIAGVADPTRLARSVPELILSPDDPRLRVSACIGVRGCASGSVDARADAARLVARGLRAPTLHVSGCAKGCAHPGQAAITLVGEAGRYGLVRDGRAGDTAERHALTIAELTDDLLDAGCGSAVGS